ncbi:MAG TPA: biotin/lipoyl-containing protein [Vicinamibacterales bacterium]
MSGTARLMRATLDALTAEARVDADAVWLRFEGDEDAAAWRVDRRIREADGVWRLRLTAPDGSERIAFACAAPDRVWVMLDGETFAVEVEEARRSTRAAQRHGLDESLAAPMPATVVRVLATPGQHVSAGDVLLLLEAMKMELPIRAPHDGTVAAVHCAVGDLVQPGVSLIDLTPMSEAEANG